MTCWAAVEARPPPRTRRVTMNDTLDPPIDDRVEVSAAEASGALSVLRRGLRESPELRAGIFVTISMAMVVAAGGRRMEIAARDTLPG